VWRKPVTEMKGSSIVKGRERKRERAINQIF